MNQYKFAAALLAATLGACTQLKTTEPEAPLPAIDQPSPPASDTIEPREIVPAPPPADIWARLSAGFSLARELDRAEVQQYIRYFSENSNYITRVTRRSRRYLFHITEHLQQAGLPLELALLPFVESAFDPFAHSHANASGLWQFIPATGRSFGLRQNWWYDGRRDIEASTRAVTAYFDYLAEKFDRDWLLVLAAYNAGEGRVRRAIERNRRKGLGVSFWDLSLPRETRRYVPQLLALTEMVARRAHYQTPLAEVVNRPYYKVVDVGSQIDLAQAAEMAAIEIEELNLLNPGYRRWATDPNGSHQLLLPIARHKSFTVALSQLPIDQRMRWQRYTIVPGDSLSTIAQRYETSVAAIRETNKLPGNLIRAGKTLLLPASGPAAQYTYTTEQRISPRPADQKDIYRVRPGDTLWDIARDLKVEVRQLTRWNNMASGDTLHPGAELIIYTADNQTPQPGAGRKLSYRVRGGDSLWRIARKFSLEINDILRWNNIAEKRYLQPGQQLILFVDSG